MKRNLKIILFSIILVLILIGLYFYLNFQRVYLPKNVKNCGSEENTRSGGYNSSIRDCFYESYQVCVSAKIYKKAFTIEGDPIMTTMVIEGRENNLCKLHVYVDSRDNFGFYGKYNTICYNAFLNNGADRRNLVVDSCDNGKKIYF